MENTVLGLALWVWVAILGGLAALLFSAVAIALVTEAAIRLIRDIWHEEAPPRSGPRGRQS